MCALCIESLVPDSSFPFHHLSPREGHQFLTGALPYSLAPAANLKKSLGSCGFLLSKLKFVVPEKLVPFVVQPHQQCRSEVGITPYLLHCADRPP